LTSNSEIEPAKGQEPTTKSQIAREDEIDLVELAKVICTKRKFIIKTKVGKSYIVIANGSAKRTKSFLFFRKFPNVKPGADIIIPLREPRRKLSAQEILGISSSLATIALIIDRLVN